MTKARYIIPLLALALGTAHAGERRSFDFDWSFKYFGKGVPTDEGAPAVASSAQPAHPALHAVDGDPDTRWCAVNDKPGHVLTLRPGFSGTAKKLVVRWENGLEKELHVNVNNGRILRELKTSGDTTEVELDCPVDVVTLTVHGTGKGNWASIREVTFSDAAGKALPIRPHDPEAWLAPAQADYAAEGFKKVQLPHDWAIESRFLRDEPNETGKLPWDGFGWYRKNFNVPTDFNPEAERYYLDFDGVMSNPKVYVNGKLAGEWAYGYNSFRVDITPFLKPGKNLVAVSASNKPLSTRWYPGAGIYRHVWLEKTAPTHIAHWGVYVTTPKVSAGAAAVQVQTTVENTGKKPQKIQVQQAVGGVSAKPVTVTLEPGASQVVEQQITLPKPTLWSCEKPHLYTLKTTVTADGKKLDTASTPFGVRTVEWKGDGFYLNGKRVYLKGVCEHHDLGPLGAAFHTRGYERKIEKLKDMGCNSIRMSHNPPAPEVLDLCDKYGILVIDELFDIWKHQKYDKVNGYHTLWPEWWQKDVRNFMLRDRNHPCIIAWSGGNEVPEIWTKDGPDVSNALKAEMKKYDTTRPYTVGVNNDNKDLDAFGDSLEVFGYNYRPFAYSKFIKARPGKPVYGSETASAISTRDTYFFPLRWGVGAGTRPFQVSSYGIFSTHWGSPPDIEWAAQDANPNVAGEYVWTGWDYIGEPTPYNLDASNIGNIKDLPKAEQEAIMKQFEAMGNKAPSRSSYFGIIDLAGFPKDIYYIYQSRWNPEVRQAHLLPHWNWAGREGEVTPVMCFSAGDEAELFVNGKSQGVCRKGDGEKFTHKKITINRCDYRFVWENVKYEPGELKVVVKKDGKPWAQATRVTAGPAASVKAAPDRAAIAGDGRDLSYIEMAIVDAKGNVVPTDCREVSFSISGPAELVGFCNGDPVDQTCMQDRRQKFFNGRILAVVRGLRGKKGTAKVTVSAKDLPATSVSIRVNPASSR